jgi:methionyl-tRNA formyltransferase
MKKLRIVFMGTPEFAVGILDAILKNEFEVVGVVTAVDKPAGRGNKIKFSAIKEYALANNLKLLQPNNLKNEDFLAELKALEANLHTIVAFRMLPKVVWDMPEYGTFNLHASLLPDYRGAAPINWAIINGETKTGVTTFFIDDKIDTGEMILSGEIAISNEENAGDLHDKLMVLGSEIVLKTLQLIEVGNVKTTVQKDNVNSKTAHKLDKENCKIDWTKSAIEIHNLIRGLSPYPSSWCIFKDKDQEWNVKIYESKIIVEKHDFVIGQIITTKKEMKVTTFDGFISILSLQFPGKKRMTTSEFLNGISFSEKASVC